MRGFFTTVFALALAAPAAMAAGRPASASDPAAQLEALAQAMEMAFVALDGSSAQRPVVRDQGDGLLSMTVRLDGESREAWVATAVKPFQVLSLGHQSGLPSHPSFLSTSAIVSSRAKLNFWWAVINLSDEDRVAFSSHTIRCPELKADRTGDLEYQGASVTLYWHGGDQEVGREGQCTEKVRVTGGGKRSARFFIQ